MNRLTFSLGRVAALGTIAAGAVIAFSSFTVVRADVQQDGSKKFACSSGNACVQALSSGSYTYGVYATSTKQAAVNATSTVAQGVFGKSSGPAVSSDGITGIASGGGYGVYGEADSTAIGAVFGDSSNSSTGVVGSSKTGIGMYGVGGNTGYSDSPGVEGISQGPSAGVFGTSTSTGDGVEGLSSSNLGVAGYSYAGTGVYAYGYEGVYAESPDEAGYALFAQADSQYAYPFIAQDTGTGGYCYVDAYGDEVCSGSIIGNFLQTRHRSAEGQRVLSYSSQSATATMEDVGSARTYDGVANVAMPTDFASVIDRNSTYYVFLTPLGDTRGLYVSMKTSAGFQVRETGRGHSNLAFDYRIVARPIDSDGQRLPRAPRVHKFRTHSAPTLPTVKLLKLQTPNVH